MRFLAILLLLMFLSACSYTKGEKVDIVLKNTTDHPIVLKARVGFIGKKIVLQPGESWTGYVPTAWLPDEIVIVIAEK